MVKGSVGALALVLSQALWVLPAARPAEAQVPSSCYLPPFTPLVSPCVPHDVPAGPAATVADLAVFAWQEFIALNWVAMDPATTGMRGRPNTSIDIPGFLGVKPEFQHTGIAAGLYVEHFDTATRVAQKWGEMGWILESNRNMNKAMEAMGGRIVRRYRLYEQIF